MAFGYYAGTVGARERPARAICHFPKPPQCREVCGFSIFYKGALMREYFGKELLKEFEITAREKGLM